MLASIDWHLFASTFAVVFVAELPDKTALATVTLATGRHPFAVFAGVAGAFVVQTIVAVVFGGAISLLPEHGVRLVAGGLFLCYAVAMWARQREEPGRAERIAERELGFWVTAWSSFVVIFIAEWGDLTQLATAAIAAKTAQPVTVFCSALLALWMVTALAVFVGRKLGQALDPRLMQRLAAFAFAAVGLIILADVGFRH